VYSSEKNDSENLSGENAEDHLVKFKEKPFHAANSSLSWRANFA